VSRTNRALRRRRALVAALLFFLSMPAVGCSTVNNSGGCNIIGDSNSAKCIDPKSPATPAASPPASEAPELPSPSATLKPSPSNRPSAASSGTTYLVQRRPLQAGAYGVTYGPVRIGRATYQYSVSFPCGQAAAEVQSVIYEVDGFSRLSVTIGIPDNSSPTTGNAANVVLYKNESTATLGSPISIAAVGSQQTVNVNLQDAAQLTISCFGSGGIIALGDAVLSTS
jgi:hypothetical protein